MKECKTILISLVLIMTIVSGCIEIKINLPNKEQDKIELPSETSISNINPTVTIIPTIAIVEENTIRLTDWEAITNKLVINKGEMVKWKNDAGRTLILNLIQHFGNKAGITEEGNTESLDNDKLRYFTFNYVGTHNFKVTTYDGDIYAEGEIIVKDRVKDNANIITPVYTPVPIVTIPIPTPSYRMFNPNTTAHKHTGPGTIGLQCDTCHGFPPRTPTVDEGEGPGHYIVCEKCHAAPPNSLEPSLGNLIVVHLSRGLYCTNCHSVTTEHQQGKKCELCHIRPENLDSHINGGKLCLNCHK